MRVLLVYESMFGNTQKIANSVAEGLLPYGRVDLVEVGDAAIGALDGDVDLLVVGGPTHAWGMSRASSRTSAAKKAKDGVVSTRTGIREWLAAVRPPKATSAAAFDTRLNKPRWLTGSAARVAAKMLRKAGCELVDAPQSFIVTGGEGPLRDGELERARQWGAALGAQRAAMLKGRAR
jgi:hypothetical protein